MELAIMPLKIVYGEKIGKSFFTEIFFFLFFHDKLYTILHLNRLIRTV